jgi:hypothetical protein
MRELAGADKTGNFFGLFRPIDDIGRPLNTLTHMDMHLMLPVIFHQWDLPVAQRLLI